MVLGINMREEPDLVKTYVAKHRLTFPHLLDADAKVMSLFAVPATPTTLLIDPKGCEIATIAGPAEWASDDAIKLIKAAVQPAKACF